VGGGRRSIGRWAAMIVDTGEMRSGATGGATSVATTIAGWGPAINPGAWQLPMQLHSTPSGTCS
jgi:hypothetical protein